jgi:WD40 repeat protein
MDWHPPRIFISYARTDGRPLAERLESLLGALTLTSWRDKQSMGSGDILPQVLRAIEESEHLALILSPAALASTWVKREWTHARLHAKQVSPILADKSLTRADLPPWARRQQIYDLDDPEEANLLIETLKRPAQARRVPYMSGHLPEDFVPRPQEFARLKQAILAPTTDTNVGLTTALRGAGGYGKTSLANYLCRDPDICAEFSDGVLRIDIGRERTDIIGSVLELCQLLDPKTSHPGFQSAESAADYLASLIGEARILLVIDDVWREAQLRPFLRPRPNCVRLVTTRKPEILPRDCTPIAIDEMRGGESFQVLSARLPGANDPVTRAKLIALANRLGNWVQMLRIANAWLRKRTDRNESLPRAIERFESRLTTHGLTAFDPKDESERNKAIRACLEPSLEELGPDLPRFCDLAVLPEDEDVPLGVIADLWRETANLDPDDAEDLFPRFDGMSLLQSLDLNARTLSLHDNLLWYMRDRVGAEARRITHAAMVRAIAAQCNENWAQLPSSHQYGWRNQICHLRAAGQDADADRLLTDYAWIKTKLEFSNAQSLFESYLPQATTEPARLTGRAIALSVPTLAADKRELARQLYGRLGNMPDACISRLVETARNDPNFRPAPHWPAQSPPGNEILRLVGHGRAVNSAFFSPDGSRVVTASHDKTARIWNAATGQEIAALRGHESWVDSARFSPDGSRIVTASNDKTARIWDAATGQEIAALRGHEGAVDSALFSPDGNRVVTASRDKTARIWDAATGREIAALRGHEDGVHSARFSPDGSRVVTASNDRTARIWHAATGQEIASLRGHESVVHSARFSPDGIRIVTASSDQTARIWDAATGQEIASLRGHEYWVVSALFSRDGSRVITASDDKTARIWDAATGQEIAALRGHEGWVRSARFSPDGSRVVTASRDNTARIWDAATGQEIAALRGHERPVNSARFSPDGSRVVTSSGDNTARIWDAATGQEIAALRGHEDGVKGAGFSPDGSRVVTASDDKTARIWDAATGQEIAALRGHERSVNSARFSPDGSRVVTVSDDNTARIWDAATGQEIGSLRGHEDWVNSARFSPDGSRVVTASDDNTARIWDAATGQEIGSLRGHEDWVNSARFSPDGSRVVTASDDKTARIWNAATGQEIVALRGHEDRVHSARFSPDGSRVVTASDDNTARIWNVATGQEIARITLEAAITDLDLHGQAIAMGDSLGRLHVYDAEPFLHAEARTHA